MTSSTSAAAHPPPGRNSLPGGHIMPPSSIVEKKSMGSVRRSTPDSEAVTSDDDHEQTPAMSMSLYSVKSMPMQRPVRRSSWLSEVQSSQQRKYSLSGMSLASTGSQPTTPAGENGPWDAASHAPRPGTSGTSFPWTPQVWQKDRPPRLAEVLQSPTSTFPDDLRSPTMREHGPNAGLPFEIPLEPSRKTVRSQSYSAGQLDKTPGFENMHQPGPYKMKTSLMHRPSRPSMLGDSGRDPLSSLREDEDDVGSSTGSDPDLRLQPSMTNPEVSRTFGQNDMFKQASFENGRALAAAAASGQQNSGFRYPRRNAPTFPSPPPLPQLDIEYAVTDETEEPVENFGDSGRLARHSVSGASPGAPLSPLDTVLENRTLEGLKKAQWQSSLGFGIPEEGSQSRRHSFADLPRHEAVARKSPDGSGAVQYGGYMDHVTSLVSQMSMGDMRHQDHGVDEALHFHGGEAQKRYARERADEFNPFAVSNHFARPQRILYLVSFKCKRSDIYYIPDNTGLQVKAGDTVIVEGDRGQDLGTVEHTHVTMEQAKKLKEEFGHKHFRCLMMFSRMYPHVAELANDEVAFTKAITGAAGAQGLPMAGNMPGMGPTHARDAMAQFEPEPRPKMIKRVARPDEVNLLREKEGNEAKAKRVCQSKVNDHSLRMEILDAEFQHDYRKLTFFYYAEEYINFNDLVTDLFKVYKTRIWMSAINPGSYTAMNPNAGIRAQPWAKPAHPTHPAHPTLMRQQDDPRIAMEARKRISPQDLLRTQARERSAEDAQVRKEYERAMHLEAAAKAGYMDRGQEYAQAQQSFEARRANAFPAFAHQFVQSVPAAPWSQALPGVGLPFPYGYPERDPSTNYAISAMMPLASNLGHPTAFTPRGGIPPQFGGNQAFSPSSEVMMEALQDQYQRYSLDPRRG
ncbi:hypothetical protein EJ06DRAFT_420398 [Trichodelitschia bisporula]|uniref:PSP1 C-terminal domain-containing protein n=1 Tax=Trichodelitschia bisporula TaxID=703511 RepID=A0A6G1HVW6_9PEZI|nr:hypothetical protein EJ06DRAFT_420398 [Trichodelitschia bisporula]